MKERNGKYPVNINLHKAIAIRLDEDAKKNFRSVSKQIATILVDYYDIPLEELTE
jgi:hypothetical protein